MEVIHDQQDKCRDYFIQYGGGPQPRVGTIIILNSPALYRKDLLCPINHLPAPSRYHQGSQSPPNKPCYPSSVTKFDRRIRPKTTKQDTKMDTIT